METLKNAFIHFNKTVKDTDLKNKVAKIKTQMESDFAVLQSYDNKPLEILDECEQQIIEMYISFYLNAQLELLQIFEKSFSKQYYANLVRKISGKKQKNNYQKFLKG